MQLRLRNGFVRRNHVHKKIARDESSHASRRVHVVGIVHFLLLAAIEGLFQNRFAQELLFNRHGSLMHLGKASQRGRCGVKERECTKSQDILS